MGYSFTASAGATLRRIQDLCRAHTGSTNEWKYGGVRYFYEMGKSHEDGHISGVIYGVTAAGMARMVGILVISPDGKLVRSAGGLRTLL